jgi:hypothetical protein
MVQTINPAVSGGRAKWIVGIVAFFCGAAAGAAVTLGASAFVGDLLVQLGAAQWLRWACVLILIAAMLRELGLAIPLPYKSRQVPEPWRWKLPFCASACGYGAVLGLGFATLFVSSSHLAMVLGVAGAGSFTLAASAAILFATGKTVVFLSVVGTHSLEDVLASIPFRFRNEHRRILARNTAGVLVSGLVLWTLVSTRWG